MKATKRIVEEAALICAIAASDDVRWYGNIRLDLGASHEAYCLAANAFQQSFSTFQGDDHWDRSIDAEAESLLRTGWLPEGWER